MKIIQHFLIGTTVLCTVVGSYSCQQSGGEQTGSEFIPDMAHSIAYEANVYTDYSLNSFEEVSVASRWELAQPRLPVAGTIARGYSGIGISDEVFTSAEEAVAYTINKMKDHGGISYAPNGSVPYYFPDTEDGRNLAIQQIKFNPFPITKDGIARGQELYTIYCGSCHGDKGDGDGYLVRDPGGKYPAQPANFMLDGFINSSNGRYYHAIMFGINMMGSHADKLSYEERWQVIHYIRMMQAKEKKADYSSEANSLNPEFGVPGDSVKAAATTSEPEEDDHGEEGTEEEGHEEDTDAGHGH